MVLNTGNWNKDTITLLQPFLYFHTHHTLSFYPSFSPLLVLPPSLSPCWGHFFPPSHFPSSQKTWMLAQFFWVNFNIYMDSQSNILISKSLEGSSYSHSHQILTSLPPSPATSARKKRQNSDILSYDNNLVTFQQPWSSIPMAKTIQLLCIKPSTIHIDSFPSLLPSFSLEFHRSLL